MVLNWSDLLDGDSWLDDLCYSRSGNVFMNGWLSDDLVSFEWFTTNISDESMVIISGV